MKKILICTFIIISFKSAEAQLPTEWPAAGSYVTNSTMGAFVGNWRWINGTDTLIVYLQQRKVHYPVNGGFDWDQIVGWHRYVQNGVIIENSAFKVGVLGMNIIMGTNSQAAPSILTCTLNDRTRNKLDDLRLALTNGNTQLTWNLNTAEGVFARTSASEPPLMTGITLPRNLVLTKF